MDKELSQQIAYLLRACEAVLMQTLWLVKHHGTEAEYLEHRKALGHVLAELGVQILHPIYAKYPELDPTRPTSSEAQEEQSSEQAPQGENQMGVPPPGDRKS